MLLFNFAPIQSFKSIALIEKQYSAHKDSSFLIKKASEALLKSILKLEEKKLKKIKIFIGPGNNGADGLFLSNLLIKKGYKVDIYVPQKSMKSHKIIINTLKLDKYIAKKEKLSCNNYTLVIDALFGTGLNKKIIGIYAKIIDEINCSKAYVVSIDVPSGLNSETGLSIDKTVKSNLCCALISLKQGLFTKNGRDYWGRIDSHPLIPTQNDEDTYLFSLSPFKDYGINLFNFKNKVLSKNLKFKKSHDTHKNSLGKSLIIGGCENFFGALLLSSHSALKTGSRYVEVISTKKHSELLPMRHPELITSYFDKSTFSSKLQSYNNLLIGPGLGQSRWSVQIFEILKSFLQSKKSSKHIVIMDADALNLLAKKPFKCDRWILTPHPGEAARLLNVKVSTIQSNRFEAVNQLQKKFGGIIVLKGSGTIIKTPNKKASICLHGNEGMATAGMGDCLSGIILSSIALIKDKIEAVLFATGLHSLSADLIIKKNGTIGLLATDVIKKSAYLLNSNRES